MNRRTLFSRLAALLVVPKVAPAAYTFLASDMGPLVFMSQDGSIQCKINPPILGPGSARGRGEYYEKRMLDHVYRGVPLG